MAWDTARTKRLLLEAAVEEFSEHGPPGARVARIAERAGVNKERIYQYFGSKDRLFVAVLASELAKAGEAVPLTLEGASDLGEYAGRVFDYQCQNPHLIRLLDWEGLGYGHSLVGESARADHFAAKLATVSEAQRQGLVAGELDAAQLVYAIIALTAFWSTMPQIARLVMGESLGVEHQRAALVALVRRLAAS